MDESPTLGVAAGDRPALALDLWLWPTSGIDAATHDSLAAHLSPDETVRATGYARGADRVRFVVARGRMREVLAGYLGTAPRDVPLVTGAHGKPALADRAAHPAPSFNLSHAGGWAALVVGPPALALGIDIEPHRPVDPGIAARYFSEAERADLDALPEEAWTTGFFNAWTRKEAMLKALGAGLARPLDTFDVTLAPGSPARLTRLSGARAAAWQLVPLDLGTDFAGCIAVRQTGHVAITLREGSLPLPRPAEDRATGTTTGDT